MTRLKIGLKIVERAELNEKLLNFIKRDLTPHLFTIYDLQRERENTELWVLEEDDEVRGYLLNWKPLDSWIIEVDDVEHAEVLLGHVAPEKGSMIIDPRLLRIVERNVELIEVHNWILMKVEKGEEMLVDFNEVVKLSINHADKLYDLYKLWPAGSRSKAYIENWIKKLPVFGLFEGDKLVSAAGLLARSNYGGVIGGVFTHPKYRGRGYASKVVSATTNYILRESGLSALYLFSNNSAALRLYRKLGYKVHSRRVFIKFQRLRG